MQQRETQSLPITIDRLDGLSTAAVNQYASNYWWLENEELKQVAKLAALKCLSAFDVSKGCFEDYCYSAMRNDLIDFGIRFGSPVSEKRHNRTTLIGTTRATADVLEFESIDDFQISMTPDEILIKKELIALVQKEVIKCTVKYGRTIMDPILAVLLRENTPIEASSEHCIDLKALNNALRLIRRKLKLSTNLRVLCLT